MLPETTSLRHGRKEQENCEDDQMYDTLKHRGPAGTKRDHADDERQRQQNLVFVVQAKGKGLAKHYRNKRNRGNGQTDCREY